MPTPGGIDEHDIVTLLGAEGNGILSDGGGILAVPPLVELDLAAFARGELLEVADVDGQLLDGAGAEGVTGGDEDLVLILQQEEADLGQVGRLADAIDPDDGDDVGARLAEGCGGRGGHGIDLAQEVE